MSDQKIGDTLPYFRRRATGGDHTDEDVWRGGDDVPQGYWIRATGWFRTRRYCVGHEDEFYCTDRNPCWCSFCTELRQRHPLNYET